jgi:hypothetical protein
VRFPLQLLSHSQLADNFAVVEEGQCHTRHQA